MNKPSNQDTRERLLQAALQAFSQRDYDSVSTREIVKLAGANISAITYHFGSKQQLYLATAEHLVSQAQRLLQAPLGEIQQAIPQASPAQARELLGDFIHMLASKLLFGALSQDGPGFIFREQSKPTAAFDILYAGLFLPLQQTYCQIISKILRRSAEEPELILLTHALIGQLSMFRVGRATILRRLQKDQFQSADMAQIAELVTRSSLAAVDAFRGDSDS